MPFLIKPNRSTASTGVDIESFLNESIRKLFLMPIWLGQPLTPEITALTPDPVLLGTHKATTKIAPIFGGGGAEPWYVDDEVETHLEALEPGRHEFIPINLKNAKTGSTYRPFYILHVSSAIRDSIVVAKTRFEHGIGVVMPNGGAPIDTRGPIVLRGDAIAGHHFWRCGIGAMGNAGDPFAFVFFCSDELKERLVSTKGVHLYFYECKVE